MTRIPVTSSNIADIGYDPARQILQVGFKGSGGVYDYAGVPASEYTNLMSAESVGKYLAANIKGKYPHTKVG